MSDDLKPAYQGELMLAGWSESHTAGAKVSFWLPDDQALEAFRLMTVRKGRTAGQRFMAVLVEYDDNEQPKRQDEAPKASRALCLSAIQIGKSHAFQQFCAARSGYLPESIADRELMTGAIIKDFCRVASRRELDTSPTAQQLFARLMAEYRDWCKATGEQP